MTPQARILGALAMFGLFAAASCSSDDTSPTKPNGDSTASGEAQCAVLGELCHRVDDENGPLHECHELGHTDDPTECEAEFDSCADQCLDAAEPDTAEDDTDLFCRALGELCHPVDDEDGPLHECHELGHDGDPETCAEMFDDCTEKCLAALEELEAGNGAGGQGGSDGEHGSGGEHSEGGGDNHGHSEGGAGGAESHAGAGGA